MQLIKPPNFALLRVREKCHALLEIVDELELYGPRQIPQAELTKKLGNQCHPLGEYLRQGLDQFGSYSKDTGRCYSYRPNQAFIANLRKKLLATKPSVLETAKRVNRTFSPSQRGTAKRNGHRVYPWWAMMQTEKLEELFLAQFGIMHRYDMQVSQPNIVLQLYERCLPDNPRVRELAYSVPTWSALVSNREHFRTTLAADVGCTYSEVKDIIQSITNGGYATSSPKNPMCQALGWTGVHALMAHPYYQGLRKDYVRIRKVLFPGQKVKDIKGRMYRAYEQIEDAIMTVVEQHIQKAGIDGWFIHDCVITHQKVRVEDMEHEVGQKTGFKVRFEETTTTTHSRSQGALIV